ncbi:MAG TPA: SDR family oxidoreductase [Sphingomicrobium sp.]|jgi:NAD(P)-dependent dehydrogenase (short-subunit alcohol dehydrogenase family)
MPTVLITGTNRGIGLEFARQYAADGWEVIATARQSSPELDALGVRVEALDLSEADGVAAFRVSEPLDLFIANAGTNQPMNTQGAENAREWQAMMMVNMIAPYQLGRALLPRMNDGGKMLALSSGMGSITENDGGWVPYRTSKAALNMAWSNLALEARERGVIAAVVDPGWVKTRMGGSGAPLPVEQSVGDMRRLFDRLGPDDSGAFLKRDGSRHGW